MSLKTALKPKMKFINITMTYIGPTYSWVYMGHGNINKFYFEMY